MKFTRYAKASQAELDELASLIKRVDSAQRSQPTVVVKQDSSSPIPEAPAQPSIIDNKPDEPGSEPKERHNTVAARHKLFEGGIAYVETTREPFKFDSPVQLLLLLMPELRPYKWQYEEMMRVAGYVVTGKYSAKDKVEITKDNPYNAIICAANGSGKDAVLIAACSIWFVLTGLRNRVVATSSSFDQLKGQTEVHIKELTKRFNAKFGPTFRSIHFHHIVPAIGGEIKLFATDQATLAEGYHAFHGGKLMRIINEAKTVTDDIFDATERWTGLSHTLLISSPGRKRGTMFDLASKAIHYPAEPILGQYYFRRVTAFDCPHIPLSVIESKIERKGINSPLIRSSIFADFSDEEEPVVIPEHVFDDCFKAVVAEAGDDIGIGLDLAAGGDEDACFVRKGNKVIHSFFFRETNTQVAAARIDSELNTWKWGPYVLNADNGGVGKGIIDRLVELGWRVNRCNNQSPARNKLEYLNFGAQTWGHTKRLMERKVIKLPQVLKLREQLTSRYHRSDENTQGKVALESKKEAILAGRKSPDRADAFILCFWSFHSEIKRQQAPDKQAKTYIPLAAFIQQCYLGIPRYNQASASVGRFTSLSGPLVTKTPTNGPI